MKHKKDPLYIKNMDLLRPFIELASYGTYTRSQMKKRLPDTATYDKRLNLLNYCLNPQYWRCRCEGKERHYYFSGDAYHPRGNYLYPIFSMKTIDAQQVLCDLALLHCLYAANSPVMRGAVLLRQADDIVGQLLNPQTLPAPTATIRELIASWQVKGWDSQYRRRLRDFVAYGLVKKVVRQKQNYYCLAPNPLTWLGEAERQELRQAISLYGPLSFISLAGYDVYQQLTRPGETWPDLYQVRNSNNARIASDDLLYFLQDVIIKQEKIAFSYKKHAKETGLPLALRFDSYQRAYVLVDDGKNPEYHHLHQITKATALEEKAQPSGKPLSAKQVTLSVKLYYASKGMHQRLLAQIRSQHIPFQERVVTASESICDLFLHDSLTVVPWLRTLAPHVCYLQDNSGSNRLRHRLVDEVKEALANYE